MKCDKAKKRILKQLNNIYLKFNNDHISKMYIIIITLG